MNLQTYNLLNISLNQTAGELRDVRAQLAAGRDAAQAFLDNINKTLPTQIAEVTKDLNVLERFIDVAEQLADPSREPPKMLTDKSEG